ncbi:MAG: ATP F0F1 synthase subunit C [Firmicutes bacterium]|nr:ATP F0F1 synthase subunit C [Bacillota bacterium]
MFEILQSVVMLLAAVEGPTAIGAGIATLTGVGAAIGIGMMVGRSAEAIARQPEATGVIRANLIMGLAFAELSGLLGFVAGILIIIL